MPGSSALMGLADAQRNRALAVAWKDGIGCFNGRL
jgi:hypothetical protein